MYYYLFDDQNKCIASQKDESFYPLAEGYCVKESAKRYDNLKYVEIVNGQIAYTIPLEVFKNGKKEHYLKRMRDTEEMSPVTYNGYRWDIDDKALKRINGAIIALEDGGSIAWTSADDETIENVTAETLRGVISAVAARSNTLHQKYRSLKAELFAARTMAEARAVLW